MSKARDISKSTETLDVDGGTIKLDGNYPVGTNNVALGDAALDSIQASGTRNTAIGFSAGTALTTQGYNVFVGSYSGDGATGSSNVAVGDVTLRNTSGSFNTAIGGEALQNNTTANNNTAVGYQALYDNTTGSVNTAVGQAAGTNITTGNANTALGRAALATATTGGSNTAVGSDALELTTGAGNTAIGQGSGSLITTGAYNTILGRYNGNQGGLDIRTSSNNIVLSDGDGNPRLIITADGTTLINTTTAAVGNDGFRLLPSGSGSGQFAEFMNDGGGVALRCSRGGSDGAVQQFARGSVVVGSISVTASSTSYNTSSDHRLKENVVELTGATDRLKQIPVHRFNFIADPDKTVDGFLAHEVQDIVPEAITGTKDEVDADGNPVYQGIDQSKLVPLLVATIKELEARITALEAK